MMLNKVALLIGVNSSVISDWCRSVGKCYPDASVLISLK